jgi:hypothetical protein
MGALLITFMLGLVMALFLPWLAIVLLCIVVLLAMLMLIQLLRC